MSARLGVFIESAPHFTCPTVKLTVIERDTGNSTGDQGNCAMHELSHLLVPGTLRKQPP